MRVCGIDKDSASLRNWWRSSTALDHDHHLPALDPQNHHYVIVLVIIVTNLWHISEKNPPLRVDLLA